MTTHLDRLVGAALEEMAARAAKVSLSELRSKALGRQEPRPFAAALALARTRGVALIAEVKRASPSKGVIAPGLDPGKLAAAYERGGAACLSVLTDRPNFGGSLADLAAARRACALPVLRKDFLVTPYQLYETRAHGADAVLLIVAAMPQPLLEELRALARDLRLTVLMEVHDEEEVGIARSCAPDLLGINARNLKTLLVDPGTFERLEPLARGIAPLIAESGIRTPPDVRGYLAQGAEALLVGEALSAAPDPEAATRALVSA